MIFPRSLIFGDSTNSKGDKVVTASGTAHVKGAWQQFFTATEVAFDVYEIHVWVTDTGLSGTNTRGLLDIGSDPAGGTAYGVKIPNILAGHHTGDIDRGIGGQTIFPVYIPSGSTVAARWQSLVVSHVADVNIALYGGTPTENPFPVGGLVVEYGVTTGSSSGTTLANAVANAEGAWVEMVASTTHPHRGLTVGVQGADASFPGIVGFLIDVGIGASSSEVVIIENIAMTISNNEEIYFATQGRAFGQPIPEGSRLAVRAQTSGNDRQNNVDVAVYGWG